MTGPVCEPVSATYTDAPRFPSGQLRIRRRLRGDRLNQRAGRAVEISDAERIVIVAGGPAAVRVSVTVPPVKRILNDLTSLLPAATVPVNVSTIGGTAVVGAVLEVVGLAVSHAAADSANTRATANRRVVFMCPD